MKVDRVRWTRKSSFRTVSHCPFVGTFRGGETDEPSGSHGPFVFPMGTGTPHTGSTDGTRTGVAPPWSRVGPGPPLFLKVSNRGPNILRIRLGRYRTVTGDRTLLFRSRNTRVMVRK